MCEVGFRICKLDWGKKTFNSRWSLTIIASAGLVAVRVVPCEVTAGARILLVLNSDGQLVAVCVTWGLYKEKQCKNT